MFADQFFGGVSQSLDVFHSFGNTSDVAFRGKGNDYVVCYFHHGLQFLFGFSSFFFHFFHLFSNATELFGEEVQGFGDEVFRLGLLFVEVSNGMLRYLGDFTEGLGIYSPFSLFQVGDCRAAFAQQFAELLLSEVNGCSGFFYFYADSPVDVHMVFSNFDCAIYEIREVEMFFQ